MSTGPGDKGSVTAFVVLICSIMTLCTGLIVDGARVVGAKSEAMDVAGNAARVGAQEIRSVRSGRNDLHVARAEAAARRYLRENQWSGQVHCDGKSVTVTTSKTVRMTILGIVGIRSKVVSSVQTAAPVDE